MEPDETEDENRTCLNCGEDIKGRATCVHYCSRSCAVWDGMEGQWEAERDREMEDDF